MFSLLDDPSCESPFIAESEMLFLACLLELPLSCEYVEAIVLDLGSSDS